MRSAIYINEAKIISKDWAFLSGLVAVAACHPSNSKKCKNKPTARSGEWVVKRGEIVGRSHRIEGKSYGKSRFTTRRTTR
jgi:hypothetical protein